jgi:hypothetical protein
MKNAYKKPKCIDNPDKRVCRLSAFLVFTVRAKSKNCLRCQPILGTLHKKIKAVIANDGFVIILAGINSLMVFWGLFRV